MICRPIGLIMLCGMTLPGKQPAPPVFTLHGNPLSGLRMKRSWPAKFLVWEKSPLRSSADGMVLLTRKGSVRGSRSSE
jgi:hypothetical protein